MEKAVPSSRRAKMNLHVWPFLHIMEGRLAANSAMPWLCSYRSQSSSSSSSVFLRVTYLVSVSTYRDLARFMGACLVELVQQQNQLVFCDALPHLSRLGHAKQDIRDCIRFLRLYESNARYFG